MQNIVIRASAGTGKTFQLSNRYLALAASGQYLSGILATTFTRKAAGEILDRVLFRLAEAAIDDDRRRELAAFIGDEGGNALGRGETFTLLRRMLANLHRLRVNTLDAFFIQVARSFTLELGLPAGWQIIDEIDDGRLRLEAIRAMLGRTSTDDVVRLMHLLSKGQVVRSVTEQIRDTVQNLFPVYLDSEREAWHALGRLKPLSPEALEAAVARLPELEMPLHKTFVKGHAGDVERARAGDWENLLSNGLAAKIVAGEETYCRKPITQEMEDAYAPVIRHAQAEVVNKIAAQTEATHDLLERFASEYSEAKRRGRNLRFEDVARVLTQQALLERLDDVVYRLDGDVCHLLLDEFQDTSPAQWRVLRPFAQRATGMENVLDDAHRSPPAHEAKARPASRSFFCVGDTKQAIYAWRGGVAEIFDAVEDELSGLHSKPLDCSYRSSPVVIETVNAVFRDIASNAALDKHPAAARAWGARFHTHDTARTELSGFVQLLSASTAEGERPRKKEQKAHTIRFAADKVVELHFAMPDRSIGVLVRKNKTVGQLIYLLRSKGIDASEEGGNPLTDSRAVNLMLSLLTLADHPGDTAARFHVATSLLGPAVGLTDYADAKSAQKISRRLRTAIGSTGYGPTVRRWADVLSDPSDQRERARLEMLVDSAHAYDLRATDRIDDFIHFVRHQRVESRTAAKVRVMTVHQSKGLQFDVVVLPELDEDITGQTPSIVVGRPRPADEVDRVCRYVKQGLHPLLPKPFQEMFDAREQLVVEESLCILYVAITRAIHGLFMIVNPPGKSNSATYADVLRSALEGEGRGDGDAVLFEHGDPDWVAGLGVVETKIEPVETPEDVPPTVRLAKRTAGSGRSLERETPSGLEGGGRIRLEELLQRGASEAADWGTAMHALFETVTWLDVDPPNEASLRRAVLSHAREGDETDRLLSAFFQAIERPVVRRALSRSTYEQPSGAKETGCVGNRSDLAAPVWEVRNERPFVVRREDALLRGSIDRVTLLHDGRRLVGADVIDFKTDAFAEQDSDALRSRVELYRPQLEAYRSALSQLYGLPESAISARLLFLTPGVLHVF